MTIKPCIMNWIKVSGSWNTKLGQYSLGVTNFEYQFKAEPGQEIMNTIRELIEEKYIDPINEIIIKSIQVITCWGCLEDQPNQLAHMDPGGCLYVSSDDEGETKKRKIDNEKQ